MKSKLVDSHLSSSAVGSYVPSGRAHPPGPLGSPPCHTVGMEELLPPCFASHSFPPQPAASLWGLVLGMVIQPLLHAWFSLSCPASLLSSLFSLSLSHAHTETLTHTIKTIWAQCRSIPLGAETQPSAPFCPAHQ